MLYGVQCILGQRLGHFDQVRHGHGQIAPGAHELAGG